jgi:hypothetical protein
MDTRKVLVYNSIRLELGEIGRVEEDGRMMEGVDGNVARFVYARRHVERVLISIATRDESGGNYRDWRDLADVIGRRAGLKHIGITDNGETGVNIEGATATTNQFFRAIEMNRFVCSVDLVSLRVSGRLIASFLDKATCLTTLHMELIRMEVDEVGLGMAAVAGALRRNVNIRKLTLCNLDEVFLVRILNGLQENVALAKVVLWFYLWKDGLTNAVSNSMEILLKKTTSIVAVGLRGCMVNVGNVGGVARGLVKTKTVSVLEFDSDFEDVVSLRWLEKIVTGMEHLTELKLGMQRHEVFGEQLPVKTFCSMVMPTSNLRSLKVMCDVFGGEDQFEKFLQMVVNSQLWHLDVRGINRYEYVRSFGLSIPRLKLVSLEFSCCYGRGGEDKSSVKFIVDAILANRCLCSVVGRDDYFSEEQNHLLQQSLGRNRGFSCN